MEQQGDEQTAKTTITVEKRMDGLELDVSERGFDQQGHAGGIIVEKSL